MPEQRHSCDALVQRQTASTRASCDRTFTPQHGRHHHRATQLGAVAQVTEAIADVARLTYSHQRLHLHLYLHRDA